MNNNHSKIPAVFYKPNHKFNPIEYSVKVKRVGRNTFEATCPEIPWTTIGGPEAVSRLSSMVVSEIGQKIKKETNKI